MSFLKRSLVALGIALLNTPLLLWHMYIGRRLASSTHQFQLELLRQDPLFFVRANPDTAFKGLAVSFLVTLILIELFYRVQQQASRKAIALSVLGCLFFQLWLSNILYIGWCYLESFAQYGPNNARLWFGGLFQITSVLEALTPLNETFQAQNLPFLFYSLLIPILIVSVVTPWPKRQKRKAKSSKAQSPEIAQKLPQEKPVPQSAPAETKAPSPAQKDVRYRIVFEGKIQEGHALDDVKANLCKLFRTEDTGRIGRLFHNGPKVLKKNLNKEQALKYQRAFQKTGACCRILQEQTEPEASTQKAPHTHAESPAQSSSGHNTTTRPQLTTKSLGAEAKPDRGAGSNMLGALFFCAIPLVLGIAFLAWSGTTLWKHLESHTVYESGSCTIESKEIIEDDGTYSPHFEFTVRTQDGERYSASGYSVDTSSTSGRSGKEAILARFEIGESYSCWYHPEQPSQAILTRSFPWSALIPMAFGLPAFLLGAFLVVGSIRVIREQPKKDKPRRKILISPEAKAAQTPRPSSPARPEMLDRKAVAEAQTAKTPQLSSSSSPEGRAKQSVISRPQQATQLTPDDPAKEIDSLYVVGAVLAFIFVIMCFMMLPVAFELVTSLFAEGMARTGTRLLDLMRSHWYMILLFLGLYGFLKWFSKRHNRKLSLAKEILVTLLQPSLRPGETGTIRISRSNKQPVVLVQVALLGKEIVEYTSGTDTLKKEHVFYHALLSQVHAASTTEGEDGYESLAVPIPPDAVPSFKAEHNHIRWSIRVISQERDVGEMTLEYPFHVVPT